MDCEGGRRAGEAALDARRRHGPRLLPPGRFSFPQGGTRQQGQTRGVAEPLRDVWPGDAIRAGGELPVERVPGDVHEQFQVWRVADADGNTYRSAARATDECLFV